MARNFPSSSDYINLPASSVYNFNDNVLIAAIINAASLSAAWNHIIDIGVAGSRGYGFVLKNSGHLEFVKISIKEVVTVAVPITTNVWFAVMAHSGSGRNGTFKWLNLQTGGFGTETVSDTAGLNAPNNDPGRISQWLAGGYNFVGNIANVSLWNRAPFTDDEFIAWARGAWTSYVSGLKGYWPLFGLQSPEPDWSGNNNHGTIVGSPTAADHPPGISAVWYAPNPRRVQKVFAVAAPAISLDMWSPPGNQPYPYRDEVVGY